MLLFLLLALAAFDTRLDPKTVTAFDNYARQVEQELGRRSSPAVGQVPAALLKGDLLIRPGSARKNPIEIPGGLIHDWTGTVFFPNTSLDRVLAVLQDFNRHSQLYPEIVRSRLIRRDGNDVTGSWRLSKKESMLTVVLDINIDAHYEQIAPDRWTGRSYAKNIRQVRDAGTDRETVLPEGEGLGVLWRLYSYWSLTATDGGVVGELRTLSLSRAIPTGLGWIIKPFIQNVPRESLTSTMQNTRKAVT